MRNISDQIVILATDLSNFLNCRHRTALELGEARSGAPIKSRCDVYTALRGVNFRLLFTDALGPINRRTFDTWHANAVQAMIERDPRLTVGWATKIINVYLKTRVYIGAQGRHHLKEMIHPPIDAGLWLGLKRRFPNRPDILELTHCVKRIKDIVNYECYRRIIDGCRLATKTLQCELIEVEQLWAGPGRDQMFLRGTLVVFYVSGARGGRKQAIGIARTTFSDTITVEQALISLERQGVLSERDLRERARKSGKLTTFTFDNFLAFPKPVTYSALKELKCVSGANLVTAEKISFRQLEKILSRAF